MATKEAIASQVVHARAEQYGCRLYRNNSGVLMNDVGVPVRFGLGNTKATIKQFKTGDFIGFMPVTITADMVGQTMAVFTNIECKAADFKLKPTYSKKSREYAQKNYIDLVNAKGGIAGFARNNCDVDLIIQNFFKKVRNENSK